VARAKKTWPFLLALVAICALVPLGYVLFLGHPAPPPPAPAPVPLVAQAPKPIMLHLSDVKGGVQIRHGNGAWESAAVGSTLQRADAVRTDDEGAATLAGGDAYEVHMESGTEVSVGELTDSISRLMLDSGMATAKVKKGHHLFEVRASGSDAVASTQGGTFAISNNGQGTVAVGTQDGEVQFFGRGKVVIVRAGQQSIVRPGASPTAPAAIPSSLLLKVRWPESGALNKRTLVVRGAAEPGSVVQVDGKRVTVDAKGAFVTHVALKEGKNSLVVKARSVGLATQMDQRDLVVDTTPPKVGVDRQVWK
jgi:hypothetical protein